MLSDVICQSAAASGLLATQQVPLERVRRAMTKNRSKLTALSFLLATVAVAILASVLRSRWVSGDLPFHATLIVVGTVGAAAGVGLAVFASGRDRYPPGWLAMGLNLGVLGGLLRFWSL